MLINIASIQPKNDITAIIQIKFTIKGGRKAYPEKQRKKGSIKGHRNNTGQASEESIQEPMLVILQNPTKKQIPKRKNVKYN